MILSKKKKFLKVFFCQNFFIDSKILVISQLRICRLSLLRSGYLGIKDAQCAKKMMGAKFHITS